MSFFGFGAGGERSAHLGENGNSYAHGERLSEDVHSVPKEEKAWYMDPSLMQSIYNGLGSFRDFRQSLDLLHPGTVDDVSAEVSKNLTLSNYAFTGLRAEISKIFNKSPLFTTSHAFSIGSQTLPAYQFQTMLGYDNVFLRGAMDNEGSGQGIAHVQWAPWSSTKIQTLLSRKSPSMLHVEHDYQGADFHWNVKALNPNIAEGLTGIFVGNFLQSITRRLSLGIEVTWQKPPVAIGPDDAAINYVARYNAGDWIAAAHLSGAESKLTATFWRRISKNIEAGVEMQLNPNASAAAQQMMMMGAGAAAAKDGITALVAKYEFTQGIFRGQIDTQGKVGAYYEKRLNGPFMVTFSGDIDHLKNKANLGIGLSVELPGTDEIAAEQMQQMQQMQELSQSS